MNYILQVDFPFDGPWDKAMYTAMQDLAKSINNEPGLIWKIWTENQADKSAGGIYLFDSRHNAQKYLEMHSARLAAAGIKDIRGRIFAINDKLSELNKAPLSF
ncbi:monooxygenase [Oligella urethralis]|uniref:monooxygenase n=1 Tax=Oligella urethralis TaxID=90245 RepID=UPI0006609050|nr:monooxygenase [Oligella urethralis]SUA62643.1 Putative monooxygenase ydhR [Oligella urethralis]